MIKAIKTLVRQVERKLRTRKRGENKRIILK
jgi:hypothetical protein